jgi:MFS transporter, DHA2 family, multidrug resistance protein
VVAMGALQIGLDKGEENDWFGSNFIRICGVAFVIGFAGLMIWEWYKKDPLIDIRLFKFKNFAVCCFLMLLTGGFLNATTVLQPQFLQQTIGYTATNAGFSLSLGGIALLFMVGIAGQLVGRFPARNVIILGFALFTVGYYISATHLNVGISFNAAQLLRVAQVVGIPFVFIAVTTAAYFGIPSEKNNQVSGLINFSRNIGGSILISLTGAIVTESGLWHQNQMRKYLTPTDPYFHNRVNALKDVFTTSAGKGNAEALAQGQIYNQLNQQATTLAYVDVFWILCAAAIIMIGLTFLLDKNNPQDHKGHVMME